MGLCRSSCVLMDSNGTLCVGISPIPSYRFLWILIGPYASLCVLMGPYMSLNVFMGYFGSLQVIMRVYGL